MLLTCQKAGICRSWCRSQVQKTCRAILVLLIGYPVFPCRNVLTVLLTCLKADIGRFLCRQDLSPEDVRRYTQQFQHIQEITQLYEQEPDNFPKLINLLQQVCGICNLSLPSAIIRQAMFRCSV